MVRGFVLVLMVAACAVSKDIDGSDDGLLYPTFRTTVQIVRKEPKGKSRPLLGIEVGASEGMGHFDESLAVGQFLGFNGTEFRGPMPVHIDFRMREATVAARGGVRLAERWNIEGIAGLGYNQIRIRASQDGLVEAANQERWGPVVGVQFGWQALRWLELYARGQYLFLGLDNRSQQLELGVNFRATRWLHFFTAYRTWRFTHDAIFENVADVDIRTDGIVLGLELRF